MSADTVKPSRPIQPTEGSQTSVEGENRFQEGFQCQGSVRHSQPHSIFFENSTQMSPPLCLYHSCILGASGSVCPVIKATSPCGHGGPPCRDVRTYQSFVLVQPSLWLRLARLRQMHPLPASCPIALGYKCTMSSSPAVSSSPGGHGPSLNRPSGPSCLPGGRH